MAIKRLDLQQNLWTIKIERYTGILNTNTYLTNGIVEKIMTLFNLDSPEYDSNCGENTQLIPYKNIINCVNNQPVLLAGENKKRRFLTIKNYGQKPLVLGQSVITDETAGEMTEISQDFEQIPARKGYRMPSSEGCIYKGDVYALPKFDGQVEVLEWRKEMIPNDE